MAVTQGLGDGYALYNGVKLPNIESVWTDKETRPCALITFESNTYWLMIAKTMTGTYDGIYKRAEVSYTTYIQYVLPTDNPTYWKKTGSGDSASGIMSSMNPIWANTTIINAQSGATFISATSPIPLDGMQVIEWDGDTTGLEAAELGVTLYKVADSIGKELSVLGYKGESIDPDFVFSGAALSEIKKTNEYGCVFYKSYAGELTQEYFDFMELDNSPGLYFIKLNPDVNGYYTYIAAYTPAAEPEQPKWQFSLRDFLSGVAAGAASRGVLRRTPIAYLYNGVQLPGLPESSYEYAYLYTTSDGEYVANLSPTIEVIIGKGGYSTHRDGDIYVLNDGIWEVATISKYRYGYLFWSNTDVYYDDAFSDESFASTLYLAASDPVPVYK